MAQDQVGYGGKRPLWQWIVIYLVIGGIIYAVIYYLVLANRGGATSTPGQNTEQTTPRNPLGY